MYYQILSRNNEAYTMQLMTDSFCKEHSQELLEIINIIPHINWSFKDLISQEEDLYKNKWNYSFAILDGEMIIGVLIAYFRMSDERHIFDSLYIHKFAIVPSYQRRGIGTAALKLFLDFAFCSIQWLLNVSLQTNNDASNEHVIRFYRKIGFVEMYNLQYPEKEDIVFLFEKKNYNTTFTNKFGYPKLKLFHPRLSVHLEGTQDADVLPIVYFSSTNMKKREIVEFIFHNYNIDVAFVTLPIELTEPQLEKSDINNERKLVSFPLKNASRFITSTPCIIEDTMLFIEFFNRNGSDWELPGLDTKKWLRQLGLDGIIDIMSDTSLRKARFVSQTGAYIKSDEYFYGRGEISGTIADKVSIIQKPLYGTYPYFFHLLFIPDGSNKTLAEMNMYEYSKYDYMRKSIVQLITNISEEGSLSRPYTIMDYINEEGGNS